MEYVEELTAEDERALEQLKNIYEFREMLNNTAIEGEEFSQIPSALENDLKSSRAGNIYQEQIEVVRMGT